MQTDGARCCCNGRLGRVNRWVVPGGFVSFVFLVFFAELFVFLNFFAWGTCLGGVVAAFLGFAAWLGDVKLTSRKLQQIPEE